MKTIALVLAYNEKELIYKCLQNIYDLVDQIVIFEGTVSPFDSQSNHSEDGTDSEILTFIYDKSYKKIVYWYPYKKNKDIQTREEYEGWVKNEMLKKSAIENGDLIWMVDVDEFYHPENVEQVIKQFRTNDNLRHALVEEWQFAYNTRLAFRASHQGRFLRYVDGAYYSTSQHFIYPDDKDVSKYNDLIIPRERGMFHFCWTKHPQRIKQKVLTFGRQSFTNWYNFCYLLYPSHSMLAYRNNTILSQPNGWPGGGFCEGQSEPLRLFEGKLPSILDDYKPDYLEYIKDNRESLVIK